MGAEDVSYYVPCVSRAWSPHLNYPLAMRCLQGWVFTEILNCFFSPCLDKHIHSAGYESSNTPAADWLGITNPRSVQGIEQDRGLEMQKLSRRCSNARLGQWPLGWLTGRCAAVAVHLYLKWSLGRSACTGECAGMSLWTGAGRCLLSTFAFMWEHGCNQPFRASSSPNPA